MWALNPAASSDSGYIGTESEWYSYHAVGSNTTSNPSQADWSEVWSVPKWTDNFPENVGLPVNQGLSEPKSLDVPQNTVRRDASRERLPSAAKNLKRPSRDDWEFILKEIITKLYYAQKKKIEDCVRILRYDHSYLVT